MERVQIVQAITEIVKRILKHSDFELTDERKAGEIKGWDSLTHMVIITEIEKHFGVKFSFSDILNLTNMGDMFNLLETKLGK